MSLLSHFRLDQGIGGRTPTRGGLFSSSPFRSPSGDQPRWGAQSPPQYTPSPSLRRQRSTSGDDMELQHTVKRNRRFVTDVCREYQLEDDALDDFARLSTNEMLIVLFANLLAIERARQRDEVSAFIHSKQFKEIMKDRMRSCLLSPNLTGYLTELPENIWAFMKKNLAVFKIPALALEDPELSDFIDSLMKDVLTKQRSTMKTKIATSVNTRMHISHLAKSLTPPGYYEVTMSQWARFAFLRASLDTFNELVNKSMEAKVATLKSKRNKSEDRDDAVSDSGSSDEDQPGNTVESEQPRSWNMTNYWEYVDSLLRDLRDDLERRGLSQEQRKKEYEAFFTSCLQCDLKKYPTTKHNAGVPAADRVTSELHRAIHEQLQW